MGSKVGDNSFVLMVDYRTEVMLVVFYICTIMLTIARSDLRL